MADTVPDAAPARSGFQPLAPEQAARLEAIARVTGAIAHDFNNLIMLVNGYSDLLLTQTPEHDGPPRQTSSALRMTVTGSTPV